jgi:hypothetical protein
MILIASNLGTYSTLLSLSILLHSLNEISMILGLIDWICGNVLDNNNKTKEYWTSNYLKWVDLLLYGY